MKLILLRHGQSKWNKKNLFTGWVDVPLSPEGIGEAMEAGRQMSDIPIDFIYTSKLIRAQMTAMIAMSMHVGGRVPLILHKSEKNKIFHAKAKRDCIPTICAEEINERMYGELQGMDKDEARKEFGPEQVQIWRRSFDVPPPGGESLKMTAERSIPYFTQKIIPTLDEGKNVLVSAHGNSLRSIVMHLDSLSPEEVLKLEIATGDPIVYDYTDGVFKREELNK